MTTLPAAGAAAAVVKLKEKSADIVSGGSFVSWSLTFAATIVAVQDSLEAESEVGSRVKVVGPPVTAAAWVPDVAQTIENQEPVTLTGSVKVTERFEPTATSVAPFEGVVVCTAGAWSPAPAVTEISSTPTHSSEPPASVVMI